MRELIVHEVLSDTAQRGVGGEVVYGSRRLTYPQLHELGLS